MTSKITHEVNSALRGPWLATSLSQSPKYWERPNAESVKAEEKENSGTGRGRYELRSFRRKAICWTQFLTVITFLRTRNIQIE